MEKEIIESNKLIAEFMGMKNFCKEEEFLGYSKGVWVKDGDFQKEISGIIVLESLKYHESWDWLMPVVEQIHSFDEAEHTQLDCEVYEAVGSVDRDRAYMAVINYIKWYYEHYEQEISVENGDVYVECPHCYHWECQPVDQQRHHLQTYEILEWLPDEEGKDEVSIMKCLCCRKQFRLTWNYPE